MIFTSNVLSVIMLHYMAKMGMAEEIKVTVLKIKKLPWIIGVIPKLIIRAAEQKAGESKQKWKSEIQGKRTQPTNTDFQDGGRGPGAKECRQLWRLRTPPSSPLTAASKQGPQLHKYMEMNLVDNPNEPRSKFFPTALRLNLNCPKSCFRHFNSLPLGVDIVINNNTTTTMLD